MRTMTLTTTDGAPLLVNPETISRITVIEYESTALDPEPTSTWQRGEKVKLKALQIFFTDGKTLHFLPMADFGEPIRGTTELTDDQLLSILRNALLKHHEGQW